VRRKLGAIRIEREMMKRLITMAAAVLAFGALGVSSAQEGHPLKGSWLGEWAGNSAHGDNILLILDWDGKAITGMINPGTDNMPLTRASLNPEGWVVRLEAEGKDKDGSAVRYVIEGKLENLELPNRSIVGTWSSNKGRGAFTASRQ
jgi:hypothetical protein